MRLLARVLPPLALIHHTGRRTGTRYATPVLLLREGSGWAVVLLYGEQSDWARNVLAAGGCRIERWGRLLDIRHVELVPLTAADLAIPVLLRSMLRRLGASAVLRLEPGDGPGGRSRPNG